jgi:AcrR family transcriptional regulator
MNAEQRTGRPRASSRETLAEAACELFLEQGFEQTSIHDITSRAGVSRSSFFNYFASKSDVLWAGLDERIGALEERLRHDQGADAATAVRSALTALGDEFAPDSLALALLNTSAMGLDDELEREASVRRSRIATAVASRLRSAGGHRVEAEVAGAAHGGAVLAAIEAWARDGAGRAPLAGPLEAALDVAGRTLPG